MWWREQKRKWTNFSLVVMLAFVEVIIYNLLDQLGDGDLCFKVFGLGFTVFRRKKA